MDCIFCKIISGEIPVKLLSQTSSSISFLDAFPLAKGHVLVIPKNHHKKIQDWQLKEALKKTAEIRPDLLSKEAEQAD